MSLKRLISMMAVCLLGALALSGPAAAQQAPDDTWAKVDCVLNPGGVAGTLGVDGVNSVGTDLGQGQAYDPLELMDTDPGPFEFSGSAVCAGVDLASEHKQQGPETAPPTTVAISAKGIYDNLICGTGEAKGYATVTGDLGPKNALNAGGPIVINSIFDIQFVGGNGHLEGVVQKEGQSPSDATSRLGQNEVDQGGVLGAIHIAPSSWNGQGGPVAPCVGAPGAQGPGNVTAFTVDGTFAATLAGEGAEVGDPLSDSDV